MGGFNYQRLIAHQVSAANIPFKQRQESIKKISDAIMRIRVARKIENKLYCPKYRTVMGHRPKRSKAGRPNLHNETIYLINVLSIIWIRSFKKLGKAGRRGDRATPFASFVEPILLSVQIYNVIDNLNKYRRYVKHVSKIIDAGGEIPVLLPK